MDIPNYNNGWIFKESYTHGKTKFKVVHRSDCYPQSAGAEYDPIWIVISKKHFHFEYYMNRVVFKKERGKNRMLVAVCT